LKDVSVLFDFVIGIIACNGRRGNLYREHGSVYAKKELRS
jgi:hypothetical protein